MINMKMLLILSVLACIVIIDCRYPYDDAYRAGDIVPYGNDRRRQNDRGGRDIGAYPRSRYPTDGNRYGQPQREEYNRTRPYGDYIPSGMYPVYVSRRRQRNYSQRPRGLGGNKKYYGNYDYEYNKNRRFYPRNNVPSYYNNDDFSYGDYSDY